MLKKILPILVLLALVSSIVACSDNGTQSNQLIKATWIEPQVVGDTISVPVSEVESDTITHFKFRAQDEDMTFMAYDLSGEIYVRANICPPCHSIGFSLQQSTLVCDTCGTVFAAKTGAGIKGACVAYPKAEVAYNLDNGNIVMRSIELVAAYQNTVATIVLTKQLFRVVAAALINPGLRVVAAAYRVSRWLGTECIKRQSRKRG
jgi:nitrite reductase/ring-hydroxylating ferredoxin subunit